MEQLDQLVHVLSVFSTMTVSLTAIITFLSFVFKPVRRCILWIFKRIYGSKDKNEELMKEIKNVETTLSTKIDNFQSELSKKIDDVSTKTDTYEKKRLRDVIFSYGNRARRGEVISGEDFRNLQEIYSDYTSLGGNSIAHQEMNYITEYYNSRGWLAHNKDE